MSFVFYDTETTGLRPGFDQIVQFAAIRTDPDLVELERFDVRCRLQPHVVPHPSAILANRLPIDRLIDPELPSHYDMVRRIRNQLAAWSPAIFVGYNSIRFDEEMLRHAFFQNLFPAYLTSLPGNCRGDAMHLVLSACAEPAPCLVLPIGPAGQPTFKLEAVAAANGLNLGVAHDALVDAETTLALCRRIREGADDVWQRFIRFSNKASVAEFVSAETCFFFTQFYGGEPVRRLVACIGAEPNNANGRFCFDLAHDPAALAELDQAALSDEICRQGSPMRRLRTNAAPCVAATWDAPESWRAACDLETAEARAQWLKAHPDFIERLKSVYTSQWAVRPQSPHPEERLYQDGFPGPADEARMVKFHDSDSQRRVQIVEAFDDPRLRAFGQALIYGEHRSALTEQGRLSADLDLAARLTEERGGSLTLPAALALADGLTQSDRDPDELLSSYRAWASERLVRATDFKASHPLGSG